MRIINFFILGTLLQISTALAGDLTVSGVSAGGYFAQQLHIAHSSWVKGAGILAAGPYACARNGLSDAFYRCMEVSLGLPEASDSLREMKLQARSGRIDGLNHLVDSKVYILSGTRDATVSPQVVSSLVQMYEGVGVKPVFIRDLEVGHAFPTQSFGNPCREASKAPYISNCKRDVAGEILATLLGPLKSKSVAKSENLFRFSQGLMGGFPAVETISMAQFGYAYVPSACRGADAGQCRVHLAFHGCRQTTDVIGDVFITKTGYNDWAETNNIIVVYPQAIRQIMLSNPRGCWDWWGYTGPLFYTKAAPQIAVVSKIARAFMKGQGKLLPFEPLHSQE